jgi:hypothetical protein
MVIDLSVNHYNTQSPTIWADSGTTHKSGRYVFLQVFVYLYLMLLQTSICSQTLPYVQSVLVTMFSRAFYALYFVPPIRPRARTSAANPVVLTVTPVV